jgi:hypothetical protein
MNDGEIFARHLSRVKIWAESLILNLSNEQLLDLFENAVGSIWRQTALTISDVTINAVFQRAVFLSSENFSILKKLRVDDDKIDFTELRAQKLLPRDSKEISRAFQCLIANFLTIVENLTAGLLTESIYREAFKIDNIGKAKSDRFRKKTKSKRNDKND